MFMTYELMFKAYEHVFTTYELMFTSYEHRFVGVEKEKCARKKRNLCEEKKIFSNSRIATSFSLSAREAFGVLDNNKKETGFKCLKSVSFSWDTRARTRNNRTRICCVANYTISQFLYA